jgi:glycosyltransferase involved in cell wall biosynthesis
MNKILVFIPMYNCEKQIPRVLKKIEDLKEKQSYFFEILIIDNGSKDKSPAVAAQAAKDLKIKVTIIQNKNNILLGGSHKVAFNYALSHGFDYVLVLHGDDQGSINDIIPYIESGEYKKHDSFLGSRFHKESMLVNYSKFRIFGNHILNMVISTIVKRKINDMGSGLNIYNTNYLKIQFFMHFPNNLTFNVYLLFYGIYSKSAFDFFPITWREEDQTSNAKLISQSLEIIRLTLRYIFFRKKLFAPLKNDALLSNYEYIVLFEHNPQTGSSTKFQ